MIEKFYKNNFTVEQKGKNNDEKAICYKNKIENVNFNLKEEDIEKIVKTIIVIAVILIMWFFAIAPHLEFMEKLNSLGMDLNNLRNN